MTGGQDMDATTRSAHGHFDRWASSYDRSLLQKLMFGPVHDAALAAFSAEAGRAPRAVLDVGCGTGRLLEAAAGRWPEAALTGVDVSANMVIEAQRKHVGDARFTFQRGDASALPLEEGSFDAAFSTMSFHHWGDQAAGLLEMARVLRPGGLFVLADVDAPLLWLLHPILNLFDRARFQGAKDIQRLLEQAGLSLLSHRRFWRIIRTQLVVARKGLP